MRKSIIVAPLAVFIVALSVLPAPAASASSWRRCAPVEDIGPTGWDPADAIHVRQYRAGCKQARQLIRRWSRRLYPRRLAGWRFSSKPLGSTYVARKGRAWIRFDWGSMYPYCKNPLPDARFYDSVKLYGGVRCGTARAVLTRVYHAYWSATPAHGTLAYGGTTWTWKVTERGPKADPSFRYEARAGRRLVVGYAFLD